MAVQQAQMASQQAMQAAQQANQQAMQAAQQANQQAVQNAQQSAQNTATYCCGVSRPQLSVKPGAYPAPVTLRMKDSTRGTIIYYTTDGWTPTPLSTRYTGPITLSSTTTIQAIAVSPQNWQSRVVTATYTIPGSAPAETLVTDFPANAAGSPVLMPGTVLPLTFTSAVTSRGLQVGDRLPVGLAQDLKIGGVVVAAKGTPVLATVTQVDHSGIMGLPGTLSFAVHSLTLNDGTTIPLARTATKMGRSRLGAAQATGMVLPGGGLFVRGENVEIDAGASLTAIVTAEDGTQARIETTTPKLAPR